MPFPSLTPFYNMSGVLLSQQETLEQVGTGARGLCTKLLGWFDLIPSDHFCLTWTHTSVGWGICCSQRGQGSSYDVRCGKWSGAGRLAVLFCVHTHLVLCPALLLMAESYSRIQNTGALSLQAADKGPALQLSPLHIFSQSHILETVNCSLLAPEELCVLKTKNPRCSPRGTTPWLRKASGFRDSQGS
uniref:Uncharacterized protein n=1 Tax=Mus musculus TaxID=10090 RepID=Q8C9V9_MOUSE|nr:unnamed protein product [Mus musculus]